MCGKKFILSSLQGKGNIKKYIFLLVTSVCLLLVQFYPNTAKHMTIFAKFLLSGKVSQIHQEDPALIAFIREKMLTPPSDQNIRHPNTRNLYFYYENYLHELFYKENRNQKKISGRFIEVGAYDGESYTFTIILESLHGWNGLLIEPNPLNFKQLWRKHRKCYIAECCVAKNSYPSEELFSINGFSSGFLEANKTAENNMTAKCYPLYSLMLASNLTTVDLLTLNVGGSELLILQTLPWEKINVNVFFIGTKGIPEGEHQVRKFMISKNYTLGNALEPFLLYYRNDYYNFR